jgi:hypothetical protein
MSVAFRRDDQPYRACASLAPLRFAVEALDPGGGARTIAETDTAALGFAVLYAAARERPGAALTLRQGDRVISRWGQTA